MAHVIDDFCPCPNCGCSLLIGEKVFREGSVNSYKVKCTVCQRRIECVPGDDEAGENAIRGWFSQVLPSHNNYSEIHDPMSSRRKIYIVLAYDHKQYRRKASELRENSDEPVACVFGNSPDRMRGIEADKVVTCDGFWNRDDAIQLAKIAQTRTK